MNEAVGAGRQLPNTVLKVINDNQFRIILLTYCIIGTLSH